MISQQIHAFLDMIAESEIGEEMLKLSDNGYNVLVGSTPKKMSLFKSYVNHPDQRVVLSHYPDGKPKLVSSAAGRYQLLARYWFDDPKTGRPGYKSMLRLPDFGHNSQDAVAIQMLKEQKAIEDIDAGRFQLAVSRCSNIWASLPGAAYGQHVNSMDKLKLAFLKAGGTIA